MASDREYLDYVIEGLEERDVSFRAMMGEYIIYFRGKVVGGVYDNRFLVKNTPSAKEMLPDAVLELPYEGGGEMIMVDNIDDKDFLTDLFESVYDDLPVKKTNKRKKSN